MSKMVKKRPLGRGGRLGDPAKGEKRFAPVSPPWKSGGGPPPSQTLCAGRDARTRARVLACASPLALWPSAVAGGAKTSCGATGENSPQFQLRVVRPKTEQAPTGRPTDGEGFGRPSGTGFYLAGETRS